MIESTLQECVIIDNTIVKTFKVHKKFGMEDLTTGWHY